MHLNKKKGIRDIPTRTSDKIISITITTELIVRLAKIISDNQKNEYPRFGLSCHPHFLIQNITEILV